VSSRDFGGARDRMVREQIEARGIRDATTLRILREVPRHLFVDEALSNAAYGDHALPIGFEQTISQPYMVAFMTEQVALGPRERVLEVGTGSGYQTAVLARLARTVFTIERIPALARKTRERLTALGFENVFYRIGDGTLGWPSAAPFDAIVVTAGAPVTPRALASQLAVGGRLLVPVGERSQQVLRVLSRLENGAIEEESSIPCCFVPLIGQEGWGEGQA